MMYETTNRSTELAEGFVQTLQNSMNSAELKKVLYTLILTVESDAECKLNRTKFTQIL